MSTEEVQVSRKRAASEEVEVVIKFKAKKSKVPVAVTITCNNGQDNVSQQKASHVDVEALDATPSIVLTTPSRGRPRSSSSSSPAPTDEVAKERKKNTQSARPAGLSDQELTDLYESYSEVSSIEPTSPNAASMEERKGNEHDYRDEYNQIIDYIAAESKVDGFQFPDKACASLWKLLMPDYTFSYKPERLTNALLASRNFTSTVTADQVALVKSIKAKL